MTKSEFIEELFSRFKPMNEEEQLRAFKVLVLNYIHYADTLKKQNDDFTRGAFTDCDFMIKLFTKPNKELEEVGFNRFFEKLLDNASKEFDEKIKKGGKA